jgi:hypothetical protein
MTIVTLSKASRIPISNMTFAFAAYVADNNGIAVKVIGNPLVNNADVARIAHDTWCKACRLGGFRDECPNFKPMAFGVIRGHCGNRHDQTQAGWLSDIGKLRERLGGPIMPC